MASRVITFLVAVGVAAVVGAGPMASPLSAVASPTTVTIDGPEGAQLQITYDNPNYLYGEVCETFTFTINGTSPTPQRVDLRFTWTDPNTGEVKRNGYQALQLPMAEPLAPPEIGCAEMGPGVLKVNTAVDWRGANSGPPAATSTVDIPVRFAKPRLIMTVKARANVVQGITEVFGRAYTPDINFSPRTPGLAIGEVEAWFKVPGSSQWVDTDLLLTRGNNAKFFRNPGLPLYPEGTLLKVRFGCRLNACGPITKIIRIVG